MSKLRITAQITTTSGEVIKVDPLKWTKTDPPKHSYFLAMFVDDEPDDEFDFELTRAEFIELKKRLAELRGLALPESS